MKRLAKGKAAKYDPKQPKRLVIYVAEYWPKWQAKYVELARQMFDGVSLNVKGLNDRVEKTEMKKAIPFMQDLKKRLDAGESKNAVFERKLGFDEVEVLQEMVPGLRATVPKLEEVDIVVVSEGGTNGWRMLQDGGKEMVESLPDVSKAAEPGTPKFEFINI